MARFTQSLYSLNKGVISRLGLARVDVKRLALAAEVQKNWMPRVLGAMSLRVGWKHLGATASNAATKLLRFIFATSDTALVELTDSLMRVWIADTLLTRPAVSTTVTNGTFASLVGWTDYDEGSAASTLVGSYLQLLGAGSSRAIREQAVVCASPGIEHGLRITIVRGPVMLRIGSTSGGDDYITETTLYEGTHSLSFTPTGTFYIRFFSSLLRAVWVSGCVVESAGVVTLPSPYPASVLGKIRYDQSGDVLFLACPGYQQRRIERRGIAPQARGWSVVKYQSDDGPFNIENVSEITISTTSLTGNCTLTASKALFRVGHVGALFSVTSQGQAVSADISAQNTFTSSVRVTGLTVARNLVITVTGTFVGTVTLQRSFDNATWGDVGGSYSYTAPVSDVYNDALDNAIAYYRIGIKTGAYTSGTATCALNTDSGSIRGIARVTDYTSSTVVGAEIVKAFGGLTASAVWQEGKWSDHAGWPSAVKIHEGRLWWAGKNGVWASVSDAYDSFDETFVGDAGPINRTIGSGPVDQINWFMSLKGLLIGTQGAEMVARASSLDEVITPTNFNLKTSGSQGSGQVDAVKVDQFGYFVNRSGTRLLEMAFDVRNYDYQPVNVTELAPEIAAAGVVRLDVQRLPDTRVHAVLSDGTVVVMVSNKTEEVNSLITLETDGDVEDVAVLPALDGDADDQVYYIVKRTINGSSVRYLEKWAQEDECIGGDLSCLADSYVTYSGAPKVIISGLDHLEGEQVVVWADGQDVGTIDSSRPWTQRYTVSGGAITLLAEASNVVVGLGYDSDFVSAKLGAQVQGGSILNQQKRVVHLGLVMANVHAKGLRFGDEYGDVSKFDDLPLIEQGAAVSGMRNEYDENMISFPGAWETDSRVRLLGQAPRPCTVLAVTIGIQQNE